MNASHSLYAQRRAHLAAQLGAGGIAIIPTAPERPRNRDTDFLFRHDSYFYYLTGFIEPGACLVVAADGRSTLFCQPKDLEREIWDGYRLGPTAAPGALGVDAAHSIAELDAKLPRLLENRSCVWYPFATHAGLAARVEGWLNAVRARVRYGALCPTEQNDVCTPLDEMRLIKDAHEQDIMRRASDITRTFPANGRFTGPQRALYDLVLASQDAAVAATKAGARFNDPHDATVAVLAQGILDLGLLDRNKVGSAQDVIDTRAYFQFYMHRTSHWLGMDVHDCGSYVEPGEVGQVSERKDPLSGETITNRPSRVLRTGMVLTIEPGIYVRPADGVPEQFHNIGIRIEDDAIVTDGGCELITRGVPVKADEIEALMRG